MSEKRASNIPQGSTVGPPANAISRSRSIVSGLRPQRYPVVQQNQRAVVLLQHVARIESQHVIRAKQRIVAAAVRHGFPAQMRPRKFSAVHVNCAAPRARGHVFDVLHARETQPHLERKFQFRLVQRRLCDPNGPFSVMRSLHGNLTWLYAKCTIPPFFRPVNRHRRELAACTAARQFPGGVGMKIALIGASGFVGSKILAEALQRGHQVTAIVRNPEKIDAAEKSHGKKGRRPSIDELARILAGHDVVISSFNPARGVAGPEVFDKHVRAQSDHRRHEEIRRQAVPRRGWRSQSENPGGHRVSRFPRIPCRYEAFKPGIRGTRELYYLLKQEPELDWVFHRAFRDDCAGRAHRQISPRQGSRPLRRERRKQNLARGLFRRHDRRA